MSLSKTLTLCLVLVQPRKHLDMTEQLLTGTKNQPEQTNKIILNLIALKMNS